jgi:hypothetical protein
MRLILTAILLLGGIAFVLIGCGFLIQPESSAGGFGLAARGAQGLSTLRADMTAFFVVGGGAMIWGAWQRNGELLLVPAALFAIAFTGRAVSLFADGFYEGWWTGMTVEALVVILSLWASRALPHEAVGHAAQP